MIGNLGVGISAHNFAILDPCDESEHYDDKSEDHDDTSWFKCFDNEHNPQCVDTEATCYVPGESPLDNHCTDESDKSYMHARCRKYNININVYFRQKVLQCIE